MTAANAAKVSCKSLILLTGAPEEIRTPDPQIRSLLLNQQPEATHQGRSNRMQLAGIFSQNRRMKAGGLYRLVAAAVLKSIMARTQIDPVTYMKPKTSNV